MTNKSRIMSTNTVDRERVRREGEDKVLIKEVL